jgi:glycosyltransferase involved in cell wall biosynthesis
MPISVVINTLNEEKNLPYCLRSVVSWATDIVVVDMHSTDRTRAIAESFGARFFLHEPLGFSEPARAFAVGQARQEWVLILDADELVSPELHAELRRIALADEADVVKIPRRNYMFGAALQHTGWSPAGDRQTRFFKKQALTLTHHIHKFMHPHQDARVLDLPDRPDWHLIHFNYVTVHQFVEKLNRYTTIEADQAFAAAKRFTLFQALSSATQEWYRRFVKYKGYKDGWRGFYLALLMGLYRLAIAAKITERLQAGTTQEIEETYRTLAESVLRRYEQQSPPGGPDQSLSTVSE